MQFIKSIFWNRAQARLRTGWRFLLFPVLFLGTEIPLVLVLGAGERGLGWPVVAMLLLAVTGLTFFLFWLSAFLIDRRPFSGYGFHMGRTWWLDLGFGMALGVFLMGIIFAFELGMGWISITGYLSHIGAGFFPEFLVAVLTFVAVACIEEMCFRSFFMKNLAEGIPARWLGPKLPIIVAWVVSSIIFGLAHANNPNVSTLAVVNIVLAGFLLGLPYLLTGDVAIPIGFHLTWNLFQNNVFGFPVSGLESTMSAITITQGGPELWTGGLFGPEGGLIAVPILLLGAVLIILWASWRKGDLSMDLTLADPPALKPSSGYVAGIEPPSSE